MQSLNKENSQKISEIILGLVARNMENGLTYEEAKEQAFNRLNKEYPQLLNMWIEEKIKEFNINTTGSYSTIPEIIKDAVEFVNLFGYEKWEAQTTCGLKIQQIVKSLSQLN